MQTPLASAFDTVRGRVVLPDDPAWDDARTPWNLSVDQRPAAVAEAADAADVQAVVAAARAAGLRVAPQATGHGSEALGPLDGAVLLKTSALREIAVDADAGTVRVGAGALAADVARAAGEHGLAPALGLAPTVGVAGLNLSGGTGWLGRAHGLASHHVLALDVVLAPGEQRRVDAEHEPDLFWALRGGGGRFAIVTAVELRAHRVDEVSAGALAWPAARAPEILERFREFTFELPETFTAVLRYVAIPDRPMVMIVAAHLGGDADAQRLIAPLRSPELLLDTFGPIDRAELVTVAGDPAEPMAGRGEGVLLAELPVDVTQLLGELIAGGGLAPLGMLELRQLGGALRRAPEGHGALARLDGAFTVFASGAATDAGAAAAIDVRLAELGDRLAPWTAEQVVLGSARVGTDPSRAFDAATWERLQGVKRAYDPDGLILAAHDA